MFQATNGPYFYVFFTVRNSTGGRMSSRLGYQRTCDTTVMSVILLAIVYFSYCCAKIVDGTNNFVYNNQFAVNIPNASEVLVQLIAEKHGFRSLGQVQQPLHLLNIKCL